MHGFNGNEQEIRQLTDAGIYISAGEHHEDLKIDEKAFYNLNIENCTLYVPIGTGYAYRHHPVFSKFKEVIIEK